jgi:Flp pilus assembly protein TadG
MGLIQRLRKAIRRERIHRREQGTSMVEMVFVTPLLMMLMFGIAEFGVAFGQWQTLSNAAREGARAGIVFRVPCNAGAVHTDIVTAVTIAAASMGISAPNVSTDGGECAGSGTSLEVNATVPYTFQVLPGLSGVPANITLVAKSVMRNE